jgi:hypothetical protein
MDPDNGLYDAACDLVAAAQRVDRAVRHDGVQPAIPAALGCLHSTLVALCQVRLKSGLDPMALMSGLAGR